MGRVESVMKNAKSFTDLLVWQKAHKLVLAIYQLSSQLTAVKQNRDCPNGED